VSFLEAVKRTLEKLATQPSPSGETRAPVNRLFAKLFSLRFRARMMTMNTFPDCVVILFNGRHFPFTGKSAV